MDTLEVTKWNLHFVQATPEDYSDPLLVRVLCALSDEAVTAERVGRPFLLDHRGTPHAAFNAFFASARMRNRAVSTNRKYAFALRVWLNFLELRRARWDTATEADVFAYKFWRRTDKENPRKVAGSVWRDDLAAMSAFHRWAERLSGSGTPLAASEILGAGDRRPVAWDGGRVTGGRPSGNRGRAAAARVRSADVKWFSPGAFRRWRDVGILGIAPDGTERIRWRPREQTRDAAFVEGLYGTGLRLQEWSSVLISELKQPAGENKYATLDLADACAKGGRGRPFWIKRDVLNSVSNYVETDRATSIRRAQASGAYEQIADLTVVREVKQGTLLTYAEGDGTSRVLALNDLSPQQRMTLFTRTSEGLVPLALWLNEDGLPRSKRSWYKAFIRANHRVEKSGIDRLRCNPHILRHSFALRWYAVGRLVWERRAPNRSPDQTLDFREQFGDTWSLVQTMLGHSDVNTTKDIYLEPFRGLDVKLLLEHGINELQTETLLQVLSANSRVRLEDHAPVEAPR